MVLAGSLSSREMIVHRMLLLAVLEGNYVETQHIRGEYSSLDTFQFTQTVLILIARYKIDESCYSTTQVIDTHLSCLFSLRSCVYACCRRSYVQLFDEILSLEDAAG